MTIVHVNREFNAESIENKVFSALGLTYKAENCIDSDSVAKFAEDAEIVLFSKAKMDENMLKRLPKAKLLVRYGVGYDNVDLEAAKSLGITVCNSPTYGSYDIASHAFALLMAVNSKLPWYDRNVESGDFGVICDYKTYRLMGKTLGLVGYGRIARQLEVFARGFGMNIIYSDPYFKGESVEAESVTLNELLSRSDFISIHAPLNSSTYHMISDREFAMMKSEAVIVNTARGALIDDKALYKALKSRSIRGAAIDVYETYPLPKDDPLNTLDNIVMTPHIAWDSVEAVEALSKEVCDTVTRYVKGEKLGNIVNK